MAQVINQVSLIGAAEGGLVHFTNCREVARQFGSGVKIDLPQRNRICYYPLTLPGYRG